MSTATLPQQWRGRSGRLYRPHESRSVRRGSGALVRKVVGVGAPVGRSTLPEGAAVALKQWNEADEDGLIRLQREARHLETLSAMAGALPCPRLIDLVGEPMITGIVMEWCPADLERWWRQAVDRSDAVGRLTSALGEVCRRLDAVHTHFASRGELAAHGDVKPGNVLLDRDGRWLVADFGLARVRAMHDSGVTSGHVIVGTESFLSPEAIFLARTVNPSAMDTWAVGAMALSLLRLRRLALDGEPVPRNGSCSPRLRSQRVHQVIDLYGRDPARFRDKPLDPSLFPEPDRLPEADRRALRDGLRGIFGDEASEQRFGDAVETVLDRALAIDPARRYPSAAALAEAFEGLTRDYITLAAERSVRSTGAIVMSDLQLTPAPAPPAQPPAAPEPPEAPKPPDLGAELRALRLTLWAGFALLGAAQLALFALALLVLALRA